MEYSATLGAVRATHCHICKRRIWDRYSILIDERVIHQVLSLAVVTFTRDDVIEVDSY